MTVNQNAMANAYRSKCNISSWPASGTRAVSPLRCLGRSTASKRSCPATAANCLAAAHCPVAVAPCDPVRQPCDPVPPVDAAKKPNWILSINISYNKRPHKLDHRDWNIHTDSQTEPRLCVASHSNAANHTHTHTDYCNASRANWSNHNRAQNCLYIFIFTYE